MKRFVFACVLAVLVWTPALRADRAAVEAVLRSMEQAVRAGEPAAYLAHVSSTDAEFRREQESWAKDLLTHKPVSFELTIVEGEAATGLTEGEATPSFADARAEVAIKMAWTMNKADGTPGKARSVVMPVAFALETAEAPEAKAWRYLGERWSSVERPADAATGFYGVRMLFEGGLDTVAQGVAEFMPEIRASVDKAFGLSIKRVQSIKLYTSSEHLLSSIYLSYADPIGGWNEPGEAIKLLVRSGRGPERLRSTVAHEYGHVASFELGPQATHMPWWALEGVAEYVARPFAPGAAARAERRVRAWHKEGRLADWAAMADFRNTDPKLTGQVYTQSEHFIAFLTTRFGDAARIAWLTHMAHGESLTEATKKATGVSFEDLDAEWRLGLAEDQPADAP